MRHLLLPLALAPPLALLAGRAEAQLAERVPLPPKPATTVVTPEHLAGRLHVKFTEGSDHRLAADGRLTGDADASDLVQAVLASQGGALAELFAQPDVWLQEFTARGEARGGSRLSDLTLFYAIDVHPSRAGALCDALNALPQVELAWPTPAGSDPVVVCATALGGGSSSYQDLQGYRDPAPLGIDADYANTFSGGRGIGVTIVDVETGWTFNHEDFAGKLNGSLVSGVPANFPWDHGTATMAELIGADDDSGVLGVAFDADALLATHTNPGQAQNIPGAIADAAAAAQPGDIVLLEVQCSGGFPAPYPCELDPVTFATVQTATANGIHVIAAAGNGDRDLDDPVYGGAFDLSQQDSGAILVGATDGSLPVKADFSNFGSRVTSNGWGRDVATAGYGDLQGGAPQAEYTATFSGTSSASPIVTGAAAVLLAIEREAFENGIEPLAMRALLHDTGSAVQGEIGTLPDLAAAIAALGIPRLALDTQAAPPGMLAVNYAGDPGDLMILYGSLGQNEIPFEVSTYGYLGLDPLLGGYVTRVDLDKNGAGQSLLPLPGPGPLSGLELYFQGLAVFATLGGGSFTNLAATVLE